MPSSVRWRAELADAVFVFGRFFVTFALVQTGLNDQFSSACLVALSRPAWIQFNTVTALMRRNSSLPQEPPRRTGGPALETA